MALLTHWLRLLLLFFVTPMLRAISISISQDHVIVGLKELPEDGSDLTHQHLYFGHAYKYQGGWKELLGRFDKGGGGLLDLEYAGRLFLLSLLVLRLFSSRFPFDGVVTLHSEVTISIA